MAAADTTAREVPASAGAYRELVAAHEQAIIDATRAWAASQASLWARVPFWAAMADGRGGWSGQLSEAYRSGLWRVAGPSVLVDCASGELVGLPIPSDEPLQPAADQWVRLAAGRDALDAQAVLADLRARALSGEAYTGDGDHTRRAFELISEGITPVWRCATRCPDCPEARFNATLVTLSRVWQGTLGELLEAARAVSEHA